MVEVENRLVIDSEWADMEREEIEPGYFDRWGGFVKEDYLLEVAFEEVQSSDITRGSFLEKVLDFIENDKEATEKFLAWFYPEYGKE